MYHNYYNNVKKNIKNKYNYYKKINKLKLNNYKIQLILFHNN
jgi:hypothetical protein